jgi:hypothetical protein
MPRQQARGHRAPYTKLLSALRKPELVRLCGEFRLSLVGSVVVLRNRKGHLLHRDTTHDNALSIDHRTLSDSVVSSTLSSPFVRVRTFMARNRRPAPTA